MRTDEFLKKASEEIEETEKKEINPLVGIVKEEKESLNLKVIITILLISYVIIGYLYYDYYSSLKSKKSEIKIVENFINPDVVLKELDENLKYVDLNINNEIESEGELIKTLSKESLNLPSLDQIAKQPINLPQIPQYQQIQKPVLIVSKYDFFKSKAVEYEAMGNYKYAIFFYLRAFAENQADYEIKYKVALLYYKLGQIPLAIQSAKDALSIKDDYIPAIEFLISLYDRGYDIDGLDVILKKALNEYPNNKNIISALAKIYQKNNNTTEYQNLMEKLEEKRWIT